MRIVGALAVTAMILMCACGAGSSTGSGADAGVDGSSSAQSNEGGVSGGGDGASPSGCPGADAIHITIDGTELTGMAVGGNGGSGPPQEAQPNVIMYFVTEATAQTNGGYQEVFLNLNALAVGSVSLMHVTLEYRKYPPLPPDGGGVTPTDDTTYANLTGTLDVSAIATVTNGPICGSFDITGAKTGEPTVHAYGVFEHFYEGPQAGGM
jgi:hypothetical protein